VPKRKAHRRVPEPHPHRPTAAGPPPAAPSRRAAATLAALIAAYAGVFTALAVIKFRYYLYIDFDLAIFVQATDQALRGSLFSSIRGMNWLGDHVSLILFLVAPLYALVRHPLTLLVLQSVTLALGAWPVFALARRELKHEGVALACAALYLLYPALGYSNLFEFHPEVLATTTLLATISCMAAGRFAPTLVFAGLSLLCKEDVALAVGMLGLTALLPGRPRRFGVALLAMAVASLVISFGVILPALSSTAAEYGKMYRDWGGSMGEVAVNLLRHPVRALSAFFDTPGNVMDGVLKRRYWPAMLGPLLFLPLLSPPTLVVALPVLAEHFLSYRPQQHGLLFQYTALVTPVMVAAAVRGLANLVRMLGRAPITAAAMARPGRVRSLAVGAAGAALAASLACNLLYGPLLRQGWIETPTPTESSWPNDFERTRRGYRDRMVSRVPATGGVVAAFEFLARLASRPVLHSIHHIYTGYYTFSSQPYPTPTGVVAMLADVGDPRLATYVKPSTPLRLRELADRNRLRPLDAAGDLLLFVREPADTVELVHVGAAAAPVARRVVYDQQLEFTGFAMPESTVAAGALLPLVTFWRRVAAADRQFVMQLLVRDAGGKVVFGLSRHLGYLLYPAATWPPDTTVREAYRLVIPSAFRPGVYTLGLRVAWWREGSPPRPSAPDDPGLAASNLVVELGRFTVVRATRR
jgi:uncharacterized membrane protein